MPLLGLQCRRDRRSGCVLIFLVVGAGPWFWPMLYSTSKPPRAYLRKTLCPMSDPASLAIRPEWDPVCSPPPESNRLVPVQVRTLVPVQVWTLVPVRVWTLVPVQVWTLVPAQVWTLIPAQVRTLVPVQVWTLVPVQVWTCP